MDMSYGVSSLTAPPNKDLVAACIKSVLIFFVDIQRVLSERDRRRLMTGFQTRVLFSLDIIFLDAALATDEIAIRTWFQNEFNARVYTEKVKRMLELIAAKVA